MSRLRKVIAERAVASMQSTAQLTTVVEADAAVVPLLIKAFEEFDDRDSRTIIVKCVWQHRLPAAVEFLAGTLEDPEPCIWQEAIDGLVAIGGVDAVSALQRSRARHLGGTAEDKKKLDWLNEALEQLQ